MTYRNHAEEIAAVISGLPSVAESLASTRVHLAKIDRQLRHRNPCQLVDCPVCEDREYRIATTRDQSREGDE